MSDRALHLLLDFAVAAVVGGFIVAGVGVLLWFIAINSPPGDDDKHPPIR